VNAVAGIVTGLNPVFGVGKGINKVLLRHNDSIDDVVWRDVREMTHENEIVADELNWWTCHVTPEAEYVVVVGADPELIVIRDVGEA
jgi:hypothetical protein